jgi:GNAT superfamily N-acetyltransferase
MVMSVPETITTRLAKASAPAAGPRSAQPARRRARIVDGHEAAPWRQYADVVRIQIAEPFDSSSVVALLAEQFREHGIDLGPEALSAAVLGLVSDATRGAILLAYDPEPLGVAVLAFTWTLEHGGLVAWLDELFVVAEQRGRGIGRALLRRALEVAKDRGCRAIDLEVDADHARAQHLYEREGFASLARRRWARRLT